MVSDSLSCTISTAVPRLSWVTRDTGSRDTGEVTWLTTVTPSLPDETLSLEVSVGEWSLLLDLNLVLPEEKGDKCFLSTVVNLCDEGFLDCDELDSVTVLISSVGVSSTSFFTSASSASKCSRILLLTPDLGLKA